MPQTRLLLDFLWQMSWLGHHTFQKYIHPEDTKSLYFLVQWETKKIMHSWNEPHSHQMQLLWYWNLTFFLFFGKFCSLFLYCADLWWCHQKFLLDTKMQRASLLYLLGSESFVLYDAFFYKKTNSLPEPQSFLT